MKMSHIRVKRTRGPGAAVAASAPAPMLVRSPFDIPAGKVPQQARSRERVGRILTASTELIRKGGVTSLTMTAVARDADVAVGSLYQYFPTMSALVHRLFQDRLHDYHLMALELFEPVASLRQYGAAARDLMQRLYVANRDDPLMQDVWGGAQADRSIRHIHLQDNDFYSELFGKAAERVGSTLSKKQLAVRARVVTEMWDGVIRLAITRPKADGEALIADGADVGLRALGIET